MALRILAITPPPGLLTLPWHLPLEQWEGEFVAGLPRGISRHVVRFVRVGEDDVLAVKETRPYYADREYRLLRDLRRLGEPVVEPVAVVSGRRAADGTEIEPALVTRRLPYSQPYREIFARGVDPAVVPRLIDGLVVLLTRLHLAGFAWGDCSLSNTLFRPAAGEYVAYLVDAETGELHDQLSDGQRAYDIDTAIGNIFAEVMDLQAAGSLTTEVDALEVAERLRDRYDELWQELTAEEDFSTDELWRIEQRVERLNALGFDVDELDIVTDWDGATVRIQPKAVEPGFHRRRLQRLTGMTMEDNQARRLLNDLDAYTMHNDLQRENRELVAHRWLTRIYEPIVRMVPVHVRGELSDPEIFHEVLEHRWLLSERAGHEVDIFDAARSYVRDHLRLDPLETTLTMRPLDADGT
ncbi:DUF4032 domain-containing protein [Blastococcus sp. Marseille-P5729]|uniref:DUF4032 domain-containing protein n=1 Tax=Blastococcus sp. Marseille-P5729 TaxID=2086582 RepID=UPI000D11170D|nr:DUF4032 domain-containing protein [Blastococcus sp. Marseille-P5729]